MHGNSLIRRLTFSLLLFCVMTVTMAAPPAQLQTVIGQRIAAFRQERASRTAKVGIVITSLDDKTCWYANNADVAFVPASTAKIVTAAMALTYLQPPYQFSTRVLTDGIMQDGVLNGNLVLRGGGDPTLQPEDLRALAHIIATGDPARGIPPVHAVTGRLLLDDSFFPRRGPQLGTGWETDDLPWYYAAPADALSSNRNALTITVRGTTPDAPALITVTPPTALYTIDHRAMTRADVVTGAIDVIPQGRHITVKGRIAPGEEITERISIADPLEFINEQFQSAAREEGITLLGGNVPGDAATSPLVLSEHLSNPLRDIIGDMLKESDNHIAEQLRWTLLATQQMDTDITQRYPAILADFVQRFNGQGDQYIFVDGSGLSRQDRLSPGEAVRVLQYLAQTENFQAFYDSLPIAGVDGTLKKRLVGTPAAENVHAKTGTMRGVCTLAGYVTTAGGERLAFAVFVNGYTSGATNARALQDSIAAYLAGVDTIQ